MKHQLMGRGMTFAFLAPQQYFSCKCVELEAFYLMCMIVTVQEDVLTLRALEPMRSAILTLTARRRVIERVKKSKINLGHGHRHVSILAGVPSLDKRLRPEYALLMAIKICFSCTQPALYVAQHDDCITYECFDHLLEDVRAISSGLYGVDCLACGLQDLDAETAIFRPMTADELAGNDA